MISTWRADLMEFDHNECAFMWGQKKKKKKKKKKLIP